MKRHSDLLARRVSSPGLHCRQVRFDSDIHELLFGIFLRALMFWKLPGPEGPSTQYSRSLSSKAILLMVFGTRIIKYWVLGPSGKYCSFGSEGVGLTGDILQHPNRQVSRSRGGWANTWMSGTWSPRMGNNGLWSSFQKFRTICVCPFGVKALISKTIDV